MIGDIGNGLEELKYKTLRIISNDNNKVKCKICMTVYNELTTIDDCDKCKYKLRDNRNNKLKELGI